MTESKVRWVVVKDYYRDNDNLTDTWVIMYGTKSEADAAKASLDAGQDTSWFDPADENGENAFLYVDQITLD